MARVLVVSDNGRQVADYRAPGGRGPIVADVRELEPGWITAKCRFCGEVLTDRGHFEDTVQAAEVHVDQRH